MVNQLSETNELQEIQTSVDSKNPKDPNIHHGIARSRMGRDNDLNRIKAPDAKRHNLFHQITSNRTPFEIHRFHGTLSVGESAKSMSIQPAVLDAIYQITTVKKWAKLCKDDIIRDGSDPLTTLLSPTNLEHTITQLNAELVVIRQTIHALQGNPEMFPNSQLSFYEDFNKFNGSPNVILSLQNFMSEEHEGKETWSFPICDITRDALNRTLGHSQLVDARSKEYHDDMLEVLDMQRIVLEKLLAIHHKVRDKFREHYGVNTLTTVTGSEFDLIHPEDLAINAQVKEPQCRVLKRTA